MDSQWRKIEICFYHNILELDCTDSEILWNFELLEWLLSLKMAIFSQKSPIKWLKMARKKIIASNDHVYLCLMNTWIIILCFLYDLPTVSHSITTFAWKWLFLLKNHLKITQKLLAPTQNLKFYIFILCRYTKNMFVWSLFTFALHVIKKLLFSRLQVSQKDWVFA